MERYSNIKAGTYKPMRIREILTKNRVFLPYASVLEHLKFGKEIKMLMVVDTSLPPLNIVIKTIT